MRFVACKPVIRAFIKKLIFFYKLKTTKFVDQTLANINTVSQAYQVLPALSFLHYKICIERSIEDYILLISETNPGLQVLLWWPSKLRCHGARGPVFSDFEFPGGCYQGDVMSAEDGDVNRSIRSRQCVF